jgi:uncharacterized membrane protein
MFSFDRWQDSLPDAEGASLRSPEGRILLAGTALALLYLASLSICVLFWPRLGHIFIGITASNVLFGRAAGLSLGYAFGFGHAVVVPLNMLIETILVLLFYPLFVFSLTHMLFIEWLKKLVGKATVTAEKHQRKVRRYGILGLIIFVWFPFSMTGPLVGCVIGHMIGFGPRVNITVVLGSTYLAILSWAMLLRGMLGHLAAYSTYAPIAVVATVIALLILAYIIKTMKRKTKK